MENCGASYKASSIGKGEDIKNFPINFFFLVGVTLKVHLVLGFDDKIE
jgi:hypothetical protein